MKEIDGGFDKDSRLKSVYSERVSQYVISKNVVIMKEYRLQLG